MYKRILVPLDNSPVDAIILKHIQPLAQMVNAEILLIHVADGYAARLQDTLNLADSEEITNDRNYLEKIKTELNAAKIPAQTILVRGEPSDQILKVAHDENCDLIAMSTHGHGFIPDLLLGSVADKLRHKTDIPILMIRATQSA